MEIKNILGGNIVDTVKFEQKRMTSASSKKVITDSFSSEEATSNVANFKQIQANDVEYKEAMAASAIKNSLQIDGVKTEQNAAILQVSKQLLVSVHIGNLPQDQIFKVKFGVKFYDFGVSIREQIVLFLIKFSEV